MSVNDITGNKLITKVSNDAYRSGWDLIFGNKSNKIEDLPTKVENLVIEIETDTK